MYISFSVYARDKEIEKKDDDRKWMEG